jgi:ABC-type branched-subunit amino acid transport system substrate-binding protein
MPFPFSTTNALAREYLDAVKRAGGDATANYSSIEGYLAAKVVAEGLRRAGGNPTRGGFVDALDSMQRYDAGGFQVSFGSRNRRGSSFVELSMLTGDGKVRR